MPKERLLNIIKAAQEKNYSSFKENFDAEMIDRLDVKFDERSAVIFKTNDDNK